MKSSKVALIKTSPATVLADYRRLMQLADYQSVISKKYDVGLKINLSWHYFYPACSTTPWQLDGVIRTLKKDGFDPSRICAYHNRTVVVDARLGERENKHLPVITAHGVKNIHLYDSNGEWVHIRDAVGELANRFLCLNAVYPEGFSIPRRFIGNSIIHLPTAKTHVFTTMTGAMKNAFGGLLNEKRHWTHPVIHETLVDLLMIQQHIHPGIFAVMDGTFAGDGPGPRCMIPHVKNILLASADQVAIDAVAAYLMGFDPLKDIPFIRLAHDMGLGCGDIRKIDIVGDAGLMEHRWNFVGPYQSMTFASRMQHKIYWGSLKRWLEWSLKTFLAPWAYLASVLYHDGFWYPAHFKKIGNVLKSPWGCLFSRWEALMLPPDDLKTAGWQNLGKAPAPMPFNALKHALKSIRVLTSTIHNAPEFQKFRHVMTDTPENEINTITPRKTLRPSSTLNKISDEELKSKVIEKLKRIIHQPGKITPVEILCKRIPENVEVYIFGGAIRNLIIEELHGYSPPTMDIDIILDAGGADLELETILKGECFDRSELGIRWQPAQWQYAVDICLLHQFIIIKICGIEPTLEKLFDTLDFSVNAILFDVRRNLLIEYKCIEAIRNKVIRFNSDKVFDPVLLMCRALVLSHKIQFILSEHVYNFVKTSLDLEHLLQLKNTLISRYGHKQAEEIMKYHNRIACYPSYSDYQNHEFI